MVEPDPTAVLHGTLAGWRGEPIRYSAHRASGSAPPVLIGLHGFKGFKDWGFWPYIGERLSAAGIAVLRVNQSHNGVGETAAEFSRLDLFEKLTWTSMMADAAAVIDAVRQGAIAGLEDSARSPIALLGHSMGGGLAVLLAAGHEEVRATVAWAPIARHLGWVTDEIRVEWRAKGVWPIQNARTGQEMPLGVCFLDDLETNAARYDIIAAARQSATPLLVVHGDADAVVSVHHGERVFSAHRDAVLCRIEGADHVFGARHPFAGSTEHLEEAIGATVEFLARRLIVE